MTLPILRDCGSRLPPHLCRCHSGSRVQLLDSILEPAKVIDPKHVSHVVHTNDVQAEIGLLSDPTECEVLRPATARSLLRGRIVPIACPSRITGRVFMSTKRVYS